MNRDHAPHLVYNQNVIYLLAKLKRLNKKRRQIGWLRMLIVLVGFFVIYFLWQTSLPVIFTAIVLLVFFFLFAVSKDVENNLEISNDKRLLFINEQELSVLNGEYKKRATGIEWEPEHHAYARDLDIFGQASLYQYINRCTAEQSKHLLALRLLHPQEKEQILLTQNAVKELRDKLEWRQQLQSWGLQNSLSCQVENRISDWLKMPLQFQQNFWKVFVILFPVFSLSCVAMFAFDVLHSSTFSLITLLCFFIAFWISKKIQSTYIVLAKTVNEIETLYNQLHHFEKEHFESEKIVTLQKSIKSKIESKSSQEIQSLKNVLNRFDIRLNVFVFFFLNTFLLWDLWQMLMLNRWKSNNAAVVTHWFKAIAEIEFLSSLSSLAYNETTWCFPKICDDYFKLEAENMGHPLIVSNKRIDNSISIEGLGKVALITGSNMAGKSTFLRSIGVNVVLALAGAPVCATAFVLSPVRLMSSMRIEDNLAENTSTFYAELKKLREIIEAVNSHEKVFILLDEILRGTNSPDRHKGSKALLQQLIRQQALAIIATHDVELTIEQQRFPDSIENYYFDVQVNDNNELFFDYKLKQGVCTSMNASLLMKQIGIEISV